MKTRKSKTRWTQGEVDILRRMYPDHLAPEVAAALGRTVASVYSMAAALGVSSSLEKLQRVGRASALHPNVRAAQYKPGHPSTRQGCRLEASVKAKISRALKGRNPGNTRPVGSERVNSQGYLEVKVAEPNVWRRKHRMVWEQHHGPVPEGCNVQFRNGDRTDLRIENLYIITRHDQFTQQNALYARYPKEIQEVSWLKGRIIRQIHKIEKKNGSKKHEP